MSARAFFEPILVSEYVAKYFNRDPTRPLTDQDRIKVYLLISVFQFYLLIIFSIVN